MKARVVSRTQDNIVYPLFLNARLAKFAGAITSDNKISKLRGLAERHKQMDIYFGHDPGGSYRPGGK